MARVGSIVACGGSLDGKKYLSIDTIEKAIKEQVSGMDLVLGPFRFGLGWGLPSKESPYPPNGETRRACYWAGFGGSVLLMDLDAKMVFAYAMNNMVGSLTGDPRTEKLGRVLYECLGEEM